MTGVGARALETPNSNCYTAIWERRSPREAPSDPEDPYIWAKAGETYRVQLLIGKTYEVESAQPFDIVNGGYCRRVGDDKRELRGQTVPHGRARAPREPQWNGIELDGDRVGTIVFGNGIMKDRDEEEVRGYRKALDLIHTASETLPLSLETIRSVLKAHPDCFVCEGRGVPARWLKVKNLSK